MSITDIPLSDIPTTPLAVPLPAAAPSLETILQTNKGPVTNDPQSGSIIKILGDNGFQAKIEEGYKNGHTYTILHSAPSSDFTLIDTWTENSVDEEGNAVTNPRKTYQFFKIIGEAAPAPILPIMPGEPTPTMADTPQPSLKEREPDVLVTTPPSDAMPMEATPVIEEKPAEKVISIMADMPPTEPPSGPSRAEEVANKIKRGGAGMTPEDWQYRNENWPAIEKFLMPATLAAATPAQPAASTADTTHSAFGTSPINGGGPTLDPVVNSQEPAAVTPTPAAITIPVTDAPMQHYDARAWLMQKLGRPNAEEAAAAAPAAALANPAAATTSYDLLKMKFAKAAPAPAPSTAVTPTAPEAKQVPLTSQQKANAFVQSIFETATPEWEAAKNIPARAFIYPTEYAWGTDEKGNQILQSLENYPEHAKKLREKIAESLEELQDKGFNIETMSVQDAITAAIEKGTLAV